METDTPTKTTKRARIETRPLATFAVRASAERLTPAEYGLRLASTALFARRQMIYADLDAVRLFRGKGLKHRHPQPIYYSGARTVARMLDSTIRNHRRIWRECLRNLWAAEKAVLAERAAIDRGTPKPVAARYISEVSKLENFYDGHIPADELEAARAADRAHYAAVNARAIAERLADAQRVAAE